MGHDMCAKNVKLLGGREVGLCATGKLFAPAEERYR